MTFLLITLLLIFFILFCLNSYAALWLHQHLETKTDAKPAKQHGEFLNISESELFCHSDMQQAATSYVHPCGCAAALQIVCFLMFAHV